MGERGGHTLAVRGDLQRTLPLTPSARLALSEGLAAHEELHARLHAALRRHRNPARPQDDDVPFLDGSTLETSMEPFDVPLLDGLKDGQWAVRRART